MPLITVTGLPCLGKTLLVNKLVTYLESKINEAKSNNLPGSDFNIIVHSDDSLGIQRQTYKESLTEKAARGALISAIKRDISQKNIVILDSLCYIKGFRYQLFCEAKLVKTPLLTIHTLASLEECLENNKTSQAWDDQLIKELAMRYEEPDGRNRWDSPLFPVVVKEDEAPDVWNVLLGSKDPMKTNNATAPLRASLGDYLQELEQVTQDIVRKVMEYQKDFSGGRVEVSEGVFVDLPLRTVSVAELGRVRRGFVSLNRVRGVERSRIGVVFAEYLEKALSN